MVAPIISDNPLYRLLREGKVAEFNQRIAAGEKAEMSGYDFRNLDLQGLIADGLDFSNCYFRQADLRGIDFSNCANLEGASINAAKISGVYFPKEIRTEEILLSLEHGTRMRYDK
ncbi:MAG: pentapeptide repeat-containing protein [Gammaproteobacteria bacterium]|nr:pentapeptide repeat-containing protein [Gammaproteobacteria bacterium]MDH5592397.1 pentapeptide repeat-containing protein [Gammaproteobacteria bacterium]